MNLTKDEIETLIRAVLKIGGGYLAAKGLAGHGVIDDVVATSGFVAAIAGVVHGWLSAKVDANAKQNNK
jgi:hypothetical protein